jgi:hypothetical protein
MVASERQHKQVRRDLVRRALRVYLGGAREPGCYDAKAGVLGDEWRSVLAGARQQSRSLAPAPITFLASIQS